jgi:hypothetical protein
MSFLITRALGNLELKISTGTTSAKENEWTCWGAAFTVEPVPTETRGLPFDKPF